MRKRITTIATAVALVMAMAIPAMAAPPKGAGGMGQPEGIECQLAGIGTLQALGLISAVARDGIYVVDLDTTLDFPTVLSLHRTNPELFDGGDDAVTVRLPGVGDIKAFWCDPA